MGGTRRTASPRRLPGGRTHDSRGRSHQLGRHRGCSTFTLYWFPPRGPLSSEVRSGDWGLQKLPRGVLAAAPRACVASPPAPASPAPFSTQILPAGSSSSPPLAGGSAHSPRCSSLLLLQPRSLLPLLSPSFCCFFPPLWKAPRDKDDFWKIAQNDS